MYNKEVSIAQPGCDCSKSESEKNRELMKNEIERMMYLIKYKYKK